MYDVWTEPGKEALLMYSTVHKLCLLYSTVDCTEVEYSTIDWAVLLPQKSYRSYAYCSLYLRFFVFGCSIVVTATQRCACIIIVTNMSTLHSQPTSVANTTILVAIQLDTLSVPYVAIWPYVYI